MHISSSIFHLPFSIFHYSLFILISALFISCGSEIPADTTDAVVLSGSEYLVVNNSSTMKSGFTDDFTVEIWATGGSDIPTSARSLFMVGDNDGANEIAIYQGPNDSSLVMAFVDDQLLQFYSAPGLDWRDGKIHYFCLIRSGNFFSFYVDGQRIANTTLNNPTVDIGNSNLLIGADYDSPGLNSNLGNFFIGSIYEVRLWNRAMMSDEIRFHQENPDKLTEHFDSDYLDDFIGLYRFNDEVTDYVHDDSNHENHAVIVGSVDWK